MYDFILADAAAVCDADGLISFTFTEFCATLGSDALIESDLFYL